ncbi:MAG: rane protein [Bacteroidota bacterium]|jgi:hypothetical protein|nr:rane protein [Bacteroidota bacterium]
MKIIRIFLGCLLAFIALNAFGGGYYGLSGAESIPLSWLEGSPFTSYFIPGVFLFVVVGGMCALSSVLVFKNSVRARGMSVACAVLLLAWIVVQVSIIGYVSWMQPAIIIFAVIIFILARYLPKRHEYAA